jgi:hypothetical protein
VLRCPLIGRHTIILTKRNVFMEVPEMGLVGAEDRRFVRHRTVG